MIIKNGKVFQAGGAWAEEDLYIRGQRIVDSGTAACGKDKKADSEADICGNNTCESSESEVCAEDVIDASGLYVIPGLTDIHFHACMGVDFCDGSQEALQKMAEYELSQGITTICPASMTLPEEKLIEIFTVAKNYPNEKGAQLVGIHMEGPFVSMEKIGAQNPAYIRRPDVAMFRRLQEAAGGLIRLCDIAPEVEGGLECIREIAKEVRVSLSHTAADYETAKEALAMGACHVTHLYNAMSGYCHRAPGVIGAACDDEEVMVELICDNVHIHPAVVRATFRMFGDDRICLISDTMEACGLGDGRFTLGGLEVFVNGNRATLKDGTIAGSVTNLMGCLRTAVKVMNIPLESAVKCAAVNPAKAIGIYDDYGSLCPGKVANVLLLDEELDLIHVIQKGKLVK